MSSPEIGQILHNNPVELPCQPYVRALLVAIRSGIATAYWNVNQRPWGGAGGGDIGGEDAAQWGSNLSSDTGIPDIEWREYYNWGGSPNDQDWDQDMADRPNFSFGEVEIRWYKHFGRSLNSNRDWNPEQWVAWFNSVLDTLEVFGERSYELSEEAATERENAPRDCPTCNRSFSFPAKRCGYDGTKLRQL